ncbi:MAG: hypothetical protein Q9196_002055 [Gyalolechia fulgens]
MLRRADSTPIQDRNAPLGNSATAEQFLGRPSMPSLRTRTTPLKFFASSSTSKPDDRRQNHQAWEREYLNDLRSNRPARPFGARPPPNAISNLDGPIPDSPVRTSSAMSFHPSLPLRQTSPSRAYEEERCSSALSSGQDMSQASSSGSTSTDQRQPPTRLETYSSNGRHLAQTRLGGAGARHVSSVTRTSSGLYREREQRLAEKEEARMLREALQTVDLKDEARLHSAAQAEASELVWEHQNRGTSSSDQDTPYLYNQRIWSTNHARSKSDVPNTTSAKPDGSRQRIKRSASEESRVGPSEMITDGTSEAPRDGSSHVSHGRPQSLGHTQLDSSPESIGQHGKVHALWDPPQKKAYTNLSFSIPQVRPSGRRRSSGSKARPPSGSLFRNPDDKIYEEPDEMTQRADPREAVKGAESAPLRSTIRNPVTKLQTRSQSYLRSMTDPGERKGKHSRTEIYRNPPSQSRNPSYLKNDPLPIPADHTKDDNPQTQNTITGGVEIRSDDIRAATSMRLRDRSPKLPSPTVVSNAKGRPIVSFDKKWTPGRLDLKLKEPLSRCTPNQDEAPQLPTVARSKPPLLESTASAPAVSTINVPKPPSIIVDEVPSVPVISVSPVTSTSVTTEGPPSASGAMKSNASRPLPSPSKKSVPRSPARPLPYHSSTAPVRTSAPHWSPSQRRATAQCAACALSISGRIVSASGQRFHPECFTCFHCSEQLECVAFYPEPDTFRNGRVGRIRARAGGAEVLDEPGKTWEDDGDESLRFYCHLDFHEKFSPRCRSCKTPIEGEVVVACGGEWHIGHFFCAQCGDPFDPKTPFVEKDGYAWCVGCHTNRYSGKCRGCKKPVVDLVVRALGGEWHEGCFCCKVRSASLLESSPTANSTDEHLSQNRNVAAPSKTDDSSHGAMTKCRYA